MCAVCTHISIYDESVGKQISGFVAFSNVFVSPIILYV